MDLIVERFKTTNKTRLEKYSDSATVETSRIDISVSAHNYRLRGSASLVLTATGFVNGKGHVSTPTESTTLNRLPKKFVTGDYVVDPKLGAYPYTGGGLLGTCVKYNQNYFYLYIFWQLTYKSDALTDFHARWLKRRGLPQKCAVFKNFSHCSQFRESKTPKTHSFGAWIGVFKPNSWNSKTCIYSKQLHGFQPNFAQWERPPNALRGWSAPMHNKSKMADGCHLGKIEKIVISLTRFNRFWPNLAR